MARPKKVSIDNIQDEETKELVKALLAKEVAEYRKEIKELRKELSEKPVVEVSAPVAKKSTEKKYKFIPDNTKVRVRNNIDGRFIYAADRGKVRVFIDLQNYGDTTVMDYDEIRVLNNSKGNFFKKGTLVIEDVVSDIDDITANDVYRDLNLEKLYGGKINPHNFENLMTDDVLYKEFENFLTKNKNVAETAMIISTILYRQGRFNDNSKMSFFKDRFRNPNLYS